MVAALFCSLATESDFSSTVSAGVESAGGRGERKRGRGSYLTALVSPSLTGKAVVACLLVVKGEAIGLRGATVCWARADRELICST